MWRRWWIRKRRGFVLLGIDDVGDEGKGKPVQILLSFPRLRIPFVRSEEGAAKALLEFGDHGFSARPFVLFPFAYKWRLLRPKSAVI